MNRLFYRYLGACAVAAAIMLQAHVAFSMQVSPVSTTWLDNGMRVVKVAIPGAAVTSIRLVVDDGTLRVPKAQQHAPHLVEHLCFRRMSASPDIGGRFRQLAILSDAYTEDFNVCYTFESPNSMAREVLLELLKQWEEPFPADIVKREAERVTHEMYAVAQETYLMQLAYAEGQEWALTRDMHDHLDELKAVSADSLWEHFRNNYVGNRMTLIVVAPPEVIEGIDSELEGLEDIPAGEPALPANLGDLGWLRGYLGSSDLFYLNLFGLQYSVENNDIDAWTRLQLRKGITTYIRDHLALSSPVAYDFDVHLYGAEDTEVLIYNSYTDHLQDSLAEVHKAAERAFGWLASDSAQAWWRSLVEEDQARMGLWSGDPAIVAEHVSEMVILTPHALALPGEYPWKKFAADELQGAYRQAFGSGYLFKLGNEPIHRYDGEQDEFVDEDPPLVTLAWLVFEWDADHALSFRLLLGLSTLLIVLLVVNRPRFDNSATSLRLTRSTSHLTDDRHRVDGRP
jgi:hypothetical protein